MTSVRSYFYSLIFVISLNGAWAGDIKIDTRKLEGRTGDFRTYVNDGLKDAGLCSIINVADRKIIEVEGVNYAMPSVWFDYSDAQKLPDRGSYQVYQSLKVDKHWDDCTAFGGLEEAYNVLQFNSQKLSILLELYCHKANKVFRFETECLFENY